MEPYAQPSHRREAYKTYLESPEWEKRRRLALSRAGFRCQVCNSKGVLVAHHRTYERVGNEAPGDLTILCWDCHDLFHNAQRLGRLRRVPETDKPEWALLMQFISLQRPGVVFLTSQAAEWIEERQEDTGRIRTSDMLRALEKYADPIVTCVARGPGPYQWRRNVY